MVKNVKVLGGFLFWLILLLVFSCSTDPTNPEKTCRVRLNYGSGSTVVNVKKGDTIILPSIVYRAGYRVIRWNTKSDESGMNWNLPTDKVTADITLYAQWEEGQLHISGDIEPEAPMQANKAFLGWYTSEVFTDITRRMDFTKSGTYFLYPKFVDATAYTVDEYRLITAPATATVEIPYNMNGVPIWEVGGSIGNNIFGSNVFSAANTVVRKVYLPTRNLRRISNAAFVNIRNLSSITIPGNVQTIGNGAFFKTGLTSVTLSAGLKIIGNVAFSETSLNSVTIPSTVLHIKNRAFVKIPELTLMRLEAKERPTTGLEIFGPSTGPIIKVPLGSVDAYKITSGWIEYASKISGY